MSPTPLLSVRHLSCGFLDRVILQDVSFDVPPRQIVGVLGPSGVGKSTLLRTLSRWNELLPTFWRTGEVLFQGSCLLAHPSRETSQQTMPLMAQKKRLYTASVLDNILAELPEPETRMERLQRVAEAYRHLKPLGLWGELEPILDEPVVSLPIGTQRRISIARMLTGGGRCLLTDEPLRDMEKEEVVVLQRFLKRLRAHCSVVMVTHNLKHARAMCDVVVLLVAGRVIEWGPAADFFSNPKTSLGQDFVRTGNCWPSETDLKSPEWAPVAVAPTPDEVPQRPKSFYWTIENQLGGMQMPGLMQPVEEDLTGLQRLGCKVLVSLRSKSRVDPQLLKQYDILGEHVPIEDMGVPSLDGAVELCRRVADSIRRNLPVVLHCKAGLGRTGTLLACFLVYRGASAVGAVEEIRSVNPYYIQSDLQLEFIGDFERHLRSS